MIVLFFFPMTHHRKTDFDTVSLITALLYVTIKAVTVISCFPSDNSTLSVVLDVFSRLVVFIHCSLGLRWQMLQPWVLYSHGPLLFSFVFTVKEAYHHTSQIYKQCHVIMDIVITPKLRLENDMDSSFRYTFSRLLSSNELIIPTKYLRGKSIWNPMQSHTFPTALTF